MSSHNVNMTSSQLVLSMIFGLPLYWLSKIHMYQYKIGVPFCIYVCKLLLLLLLFFLFDILKAFQ